MSSYSIQADSTSRATPKLNRGPVKIIATVPVYWMIGENPVVNPNKAALLQAGETKDLFIPVRCSSLAVMAVKEPGVVTVIEQPGGARASCSA